MSRKKKIFALYDSKSKLYVSLTTENSVELVEFYHAKWFKSANEAERVLKKLQETVEVVPVVVEDMFNCY
jgi:hypothetical protein